MRKERESLLEISAKIGEYYKIIISGGIMVEYVDRTKEISSDLKACKTAFDEVNIPWVIIDGIVLGYARYKDIMPWDTDLDVGIFSEITNEQWGFLLLSLQKHGFKKVVEVNDFAAFSRETILDLHVFHKEGDFYVCYPKPHKHRYIERAKWFNEPQIVDFIGDRYPMPNHVEDFVSAHYGSDWKTNIVKNHDEYLVDARGSLDHLAWINGNSRCNKNGDLWPKILTIEEHL